MHVVKEEGEEKVETTTLETQEVKEEVQETSGIDKGHLNNKPVKPVSGIVITDPAFGGYRILRSFGKVKVDHPDKKGSTYDCSQQGGIKEAMGYIFEMRVVNELQGEMSLIQYNAGVKAIENELIKASGGETK
jgi:hypothetical protein